MYYTEDRKANNIIFHFVKIMIVTEIMEDSF